MPNPYYGRMVPRIEDKYIYMEAVTQGKDPVAEGVVMVPESEQYGKSEIEEVLREREVTHGSFEVTAEIAQLLKNIFRSYFTSQKVSFVQRESLENIGQKIARILSGHSWTKEHWFDIIGYAQLAIRQIEEKEAADAQNKF